MCALPSKDFVWANEGLREIDQGHARGNRKALLVQSKLQSFLEKLGMCTHRHNGSFILKRFLFLVVIAAGLIWAKLETNVENLWIEGDGRLEKELEYTKKSLGDGYGVTNELLIQTPNEEGTNILTVQALKRHLDILMRVTDVSVDLFDQRWKLRDICYTLDPSFNDPELGQLMPCVIISPLDCFWEGAKPLGPQRKLVLLGENSTNTPALKWKNLTITSLIQAVRKIPHGQDYEKFMWMLKEGGISSGYVMKPCLDPYDPECPKTAPNYKTKKKPDIGVELTGGCKGFATKYMDWPEELIVGGTVKNRTGVLRRAEAYQSIIMLMGSQQLYTRWRGKAKVNHMTHPEWTNETASQLLEAWKREFTKVINSADQSQEDSTVLAFSSTSLNDLLKDFSQTSYLYVGIGYGLMLFYASVTHGALGFGGVLLVTFAVVAGLGCCSIFQIKFNDASKMILPFIALGLGVNDIFLLCHTYSSAKENDQDPAAYLRASTGVSVFLKSFNNMFAFFMVAPIPIPALRSFSLQAAIVVLFNFLAVIVIFPAMIVIDKNRRSRDCDLLCCCKRSTRIEPLDPRTSGTSENDSSFVQVHDIYRLDPLPKQDRNSAFVIPGIIQDIDSQTGHSSSVVTVEVSAVTEWRHHKRARFRRGKEMEESNHRELPAMDNIRTNNEVATSNGSLGASTNVAQTQTEIEQQRRRDSGNTRPCYLSQRTTRSSKIYPEQSASGNNLCTQSVAWPEQRHKGHGCTSCPADAEGSSSRDDRDVRTQQFADAPKKVAFTLPAKSASEGETAVAVDEGSSLNGTLGSHSRSSPGLESAMSRVSTSQSMQDSDSKPNSWYSFLKKKLQYLSLAYFARRYYGVWLQKMPVKVVVIIFFLSLLAVKIYGALLVEDGVDLTDVVPRKSLEYKFVQARLKYFSFYPVALVTQDFDYANQQKKLFSYYEEFKNILNMTGIPGSRESPKFWLMSFREWLNDTQVSFDQDWANNSITYSGWFDNATSTGVIAYKLLSQNDSTDAIDTSKVRNYKLVSDDGIIRPEVFYKALTTWTNEDFFGYQFSQAVIKPKTVSIRNKRNDKTMKVPTAKPIIFAKINFNVIGFNETKYFVKLIEAVRKICDKYSDDGLPNYPSGVPFTFWEQHIWLRRQILIAISISLAVSFVVMAIILFNLWAAAVICLFVVIITIEVYGFMGLAGIKLSAFPAVRVILSVGVGMDFTVHLSMAFFHALGDRNQRMQKAIEHAFAPSVNGAISSLLSVVVLAGSQFHFEFRYFFILHVALILIITLNGVVFLPVFLSLAGPGPVVTEIPAPAIASNPLTIQNPFADRYVYNEPEPEEIELHSVKEVNHKSNVHGAVLERTNETGAKVELSDNEPRSEDMTTGEGPSPCVLAWT